MGNCSCLERPRVAAWDVDDDWGVPAQRSVGAVAARRRAIGDGTKVKIRMTRGQLRRLLESAGHGGSTTDEGVVAEIMSMGAVRVEVVAAAGQRRRAAGVHHKPPELETIQEDDFVDE